MLINQLVSVGYSKTKAMGIIGASRSRVFYETNPRPRTDNPIPHHQRRINRLPDATVTGIVEGVRKFVCEALI